MWQSARRPSCGSAAASVERQGETSLLQFRLAAVKILYPSYEKRLLGECLRQSSSLELNCRADVRGRKKKSRLVHTHSQRNRLHAFSFGSAGRKVWQPAHPSGSLPSVLMRRLRFVWPPPWNVYVGLR